MATRTTTTRTTTGACAPSANSYPACHAEFSFSELVQAYFDCRRTKRNSASALKFELDLERNLVELDAELRSETYKPGRSICFVITHPKPREVWAAEFRDRIVHHLLYNHVSTSIHSRFIADSCACIPGRGTLYGAKRLEEKARSITQDWSKPAFYLKCDLANFFVSIDKQILGELLTKHIAEPWWRALAHQILFHDSRENFEQRCGARMMALVPAHKRLAQQPATHGLPIGNLSSQFFANIYLNELDQFVKHQLHARHYIRYVDDFVLLHKSPRWLSDAKEQIEQFLALKLNARLNTSKTIMQPVRRGIDFVGQVILPHRRVTRKRTLTHALRRIETTPAPQFRDTANSYFGLLRQASHSHSARLQFARAILRQGKSVNAEFTKTSQKGAA
jgi:retron-type reverse transcriptase